MKLGVAGLLGPNPERSAAEIRRLGFSAASWHLQGLPSARQLARVRAVLAAEGLDLCQIAPPPYNSLVAIEQIHREAGIQSLQQMTETAAELGAGNLYVRPGSLSPGAWEPHPENHCPETRRRLAESLAPVAQYAEQCGVLLAIEAHAVSPLDTPEAVREVLDEVGSPALRFNVDPVNFVRSLDEAYGNASLIARMFDLLGDVTICAHAKDLRVEPRLVVHIEECPPGMGLLDQGLFLRRFQQCCPEGVVLIEHLPAEQVPAARRVLLAAARDAGVPFRED
jgi:sugar phosphate isomerase/epimerase